MTYEDWCPEWNDPASIPERAVQFAAEVGPDEVLRKLASLCLCGQLEHRFYWRVQAILKPSKFQISPPVDDRRFDLEA